jgi:pimeloyl-ACP methyl ester carboxylesterase
MPYATNDGVAYGRRHQAAVVVAVQNDLEIGAARIWGHFMGDVALALGRHHPDPLTALVVTGYSPIAAAGEETAEMAAWATDLQGGMEGFAAGYERR